MLPRSRDFPVLTLSTSSTTSMAHLLKPCISEYILIPSLHFTHSLPGKKKSGLGINFFDQVEHNCSVMIWLPEVLLRSLRLLNLSVIFPPSLEGYRIFFLPLIFWAIMVMDLSIGLFSFIVLAFPIWKFMTTSFRYFSRIISSVISLLTCFSVFLFWNSFYSNVEPSQMIL